MIARDSFLEIVHSERIARISSGSRRESLLNDKKWEWNYLRDKCRELLLEEFYDSYMQRLRISYLALFIIMDMMKVGMILFVMLTPMSNFDGDILAEKLVYILTSVFVWVILAVNFRVELVENYPWVMDATSCIAAILMALTNTGLSVYHAVINSKLLIPAYGSYIILTVYLFLPLVDDFHAFMLGVAVTLLYFISFFLVATQQLQYRAKTFGFDKFITQLIYLSCNNLVGIYFRLMKQINIRIAFLDRHTLINENLSLRYAREEEQKLLLSIIPEHIVDKIENHVKLRFENIIFKRRRPVSFRESQVGKIRWRHTKSEELFIEPHENVSILYADVVNYTYLTTTLDAKALVEILHDLFVKFDTASEEHNVLRIKFLGDCYYAVAGLSAPNERHAKCCVDLGLRMIKDIQDVRTRHNLNINMRIGVHTGSIFSGVIGICKLQYDVWSKDLDIANRLEQTGEAGKVHVSEETLRHLKGEYNYEEGPPQAKEDPLLNSLNIRTFLIETSTLSSVDEEDLNLYKVKRQSHRTLASRSFMHSKIYEYEQFQQQAEIEIGRELKKMPIGIMRFNRFNGLGEGESLEKNFRSKISSLFLHYKDFSTELQYLREYDTMLKYSVLMAFVIFCCIMAIQCINEIKLPDFLYIALMIVLMFITWFKKIWRLCIAETEMSIPTNIFTLFFFNASMQIQSSLIARMVIYLLIVLTHSSTTFIQLLDCEDWALYHPGHSLIEQRNLDDIIKSRKCEMSYDTWSITKSLELTICMMFLFSRIPNLIKYALGILIAMVYSIVVFCRYYIVYKKSRTTDYGLGAEYSHILIIVITLMLFYLMDYQTEFISKVDFNLRFQLQKKQEDAEITNASITMLINNILPSHVADIYISQKMTNELYYEEHDNVAVMFATIKKYDIESIGLGVLNEIICHFDEVVKRFESEGVFKVEKIKLAGWTYMAACGLNLGRSQNINQRSLYRLLDGRKRSDIASGLEASYDAIPSTSKEAARRSRKRTVSFSRQDYMVHVMAEFALELMKTMNALNSENLQWQDGYFDYGLLRIGISNGPTMAGVIGSSKPHYDIWGNCVNMASRMDSTGVPGSIQVTQETAEILRAFEIQCNYRGMTFVKGLGKIPTYFIGIDENLNFVSTTERTSAN